MEFSHRSVLLWECIEALNIRPDGVYLDGKMFALVGDDQLFIKITKEGATLAPQLPKAPPYDGAKDYFLYEDVDDREHMIAFVQATCRELPMPKPKKKKGAT